MRTAAFQCGIFITLGIATASQAQAVFPCSAASGRGDMASGAYVVPSTFFSQLGITPANLDATVNAVGIRYVPALAGTQTAVTAHFLVPTKPGVGIRLLILDGLITPDGALPKTLLDETAPKNAEIKTIFPQSGILSVLPLKGSPGHWDSSNTIHGAAPNNDRTAQLTYNVSGQPSIPPDLMLYLCGAGGTHVIFTVPVNRAPKAKLARSTQKGPG
jgi:hypothetical protein